MVLDEKGNGSYHEIRGRLVNPDGKPLEPQNNGTDYFIGRFAKDQRYHLLGQRPHGRSDLFSAASESCGDLGIVELPEGRTKLSDLEKGEMLTVTPHGSSDSYKIVFEERN